MCSNDLCYGEDSGVEDFTPRNDGRDDLDVYRSVVLVYGTQSRSNDLSSDSANCNRDGRHDRRLRRLVRA